MATENARDRRLIGYLLGQLSEAERTELEDRFFAEDPLFEYLAAVEMELIDAYARGELSEIDRGQFEHRLLRSPRFQARVALALQLHARAAATVSVSAPAREAAPQKAQASADKRTGSPLVGAVAAGVAVLAAVGGWWAYQSSSPRAATVENAPAPAAAQYVPVSTRPVAPPPPLTAASLTAAPSGPVALVLSPGSVGNREGAAVLTMPPGANVVNIQIDHDGPAHERYAVIVSTRARERVWTELNMAPRAPGAKGVVLQIPVESLPSGDYLVTLSGGALEARRLEALADYTVRVDRHPTINKLVRLLLGSSEEASWLLDSSAIPPSGVVRRRRHHDMSRSESHSPFCCPSASCSQRVRVPCSLRR